MPILFVEKVKKKGELLGKLLTVLFSSCFSSCFSLVVNFFQWDWTMPLEYMIKCMLFTRK